MKDGLPAAIISEKDGSEYLLISGDGSSKPPFYIQKYELDRGRFERFQSEVMSAGSEVAKGSVVNQVKEGTGLHKDAIGFGYPEGGNQPVTFVGYEVADAYARWAGARLPTASEFQRAAGFPERKVPWEGRAVAEESPVNHSFGDTALGETAKKDGFTFTAPVNEFEKFAAGSGALNLIGHIAEWIEDASPGQEHMVLGGSFADQLETEEQVRKALTQPVPAKDEWKNGTIGFRLAVSPEKNR
jgi:formylglycine-generating enzyme required for sulfatase activity